MGYGPACRPVPSAPLQSLLQPLPGIATQSVCDRSRELCSGYDTTVPVYLDIGRSMCIVVPVDDERRAFCAGRSRSRLVLAVLRHAARYIAITQEPLSSATTAPIEQPCCGYCIRTVRRLSKWIRLLSPCNDSVTTSSWRFGIQNTSGGYNFNNRIITINRIDGPLIPANACHIRANGARWGVPRPPLPPQIPTGALQDGGAIRLYRL